MSGHLWWWWWLYSKGTVKRALKWSLYWGKFLFLWIRQKIYRDIWKNPETHMLTAGTREVRQQWPAWERTVEKSVLKGGRVAGWREARLVEHGLWCAAKRICQWKATWPFCQGQGKWLLSAHRTYFTSAFRVLAFISFYSPAWTHCWIYALPEA